MNGRKLYPFLFSAPCLACVAGVRKGRGRELGRETHTLSCAPKFPLPLSTPATQATPCPFRVPFTFASSPLSESLEQATLIQVCHSRSSSPGFAQILHGNFLGKSCCLVYKKTKGSHNFNLILSVFNPILMQRIQLHHIILLRKRNRWYPGCYALKY